MKPSRRKIWVALVGVAFLLRAGAAIYWQQQTGQQGNLFRFGDSHSYWTLAEHLARGEAYQYGSQHAQIFRAPLYPLMLAPFTVFSKPETGVLAARLSGCGLGVVAVGLLMVLARRLAGDCASWIAGGIAALHPGAIGMSIVILSEALFVPLMVGCLLCWQNAWAAPTKRQTAWWAVAVGGLCGLAVLARPSWLLFLPFVAAVGLLTGRRRRHLGLILWAFTAFSLVMSPWWIRNAQITGHFVPTTLQVGPSLYDGLHPGASGASDEGMAFMQVFLAEQREADRQATGPLDGTLEYRLNRRASRAAWVWASQHPADVLRLAGRKFVRTWSLWPDGAGTTSLPIRFALSVSSAGILVLALLGVVLLRTRGWAVAICVAPCLYFTLLHMVFVGSIRYREPGLFVLIALAACAVAHWAGCSSGTDSSSLNAADIPPQSLQGSTSEPSSSTSDRNLDG